MASVQLVILSVIFLGLPAGLSFLLGPIRTMVLAIFVSALLADAFTTKIGLRHGMRELSPLFRVLRKYVSTDGFIVISTLLGVVLGLFSSFALPQFVLLGLTALIMVSVLGNSFLLLHRVTVEQELRNPQEH